MEIAGSKKVEVSMFDAISGMQQALIIQAAVICLGMTMFVVCALVPFIRVLKDFVAVLNRHIQQPRHYDDIPKIIKNEQNLQNLQNSKISTKLEKNEQKKA